MGTVSIVTRFRIPSISIADGIPLEGEGEDEDDDDVDDDEEEKRKQCFVRKQIGGRNVRSQPGKPTRER